MVANVTTMQCAGTAGVPDGQAWAISGWMGQSRMLINASFQQRVHGNAEPPGFVGKAGFGLA